MQEYILFTFLDWSKEKDLIWELGLWFIIGDVLIEAQLVLNEPTGSEMQNITAKILFF